MPTRLITDADGHRWTASEDGRYQSDDRAAMPIGEYDRAVIRFDAVGGRESMLFRGEVPLDWHKVASDDELVSWLVTARAGRNH